MPGGGGEAAPRGVPLSGSIRSFVHLVGGREDVRALIASLVDMVSWRAKGATGPLEYEIAGYFALCRNLHRLRCAGCRGQRYVEPSPTDGDRLFWKNAKTFARL
jgi:hypothetical protein